MDTSIIVYGFLFLVGNTIVVIFFQKRLLKGNTSTPLVLATLVISTIAELVYQGEPKNPSLTIYAVGAFYFGTTFAPQSNE